MRQRAKARNLTVSQFFHASILLLKMNFVSILKIFCRSTVTWKILWRSSWSISGMKNKKNWPQFVKWTTVYWPRSVDLPSSAIILLVRSAKVVVGLAFRTCRTCTALEDSLASLSDRICLSSSEISLSLPSTRDSRLCTDTSDTNSTKMQESMLKIATKNTNERNRFEVKHFAGFRSLLICCSIWVKLNSRFYL